MMNNIKISLFTFIGYIRWNFIYGIITKFRYCRICCCNLFKLLVEIKLYLFKEFYLLRK